MEISTVWIAFNHKQEREKKNKFLKIASRNNRSPLDIKFLKCLAMSKAGT